MGVTITVQNLSSVLTDAEAEKIVAALQWQAEEQYNKSRWVTEKLAEPCDKVEFIAKGETIPADTWHLELLDTSDQPGALGYHEDQAFDKAGAPTGPAKASERTSRGLRADAPEIPLMKIFAKTSQEDGVAPSEVASHEMLEALVDPQVVKTVRTVKKPSEGRIYIVEVGDPVQETGKAAPNGEVLANFAEPAYFELDTESGGKYDYEGVLTGPVPARTPGGYLSYATEAEPENWQQEHGAHAATAPEKGAAEAEAAESEVEAEPQGEAGIFVIRARNQENGTGVTFGPAGGEGWATAVDAEGGVEELRRVGDPRLLPTFDTEVLGITSAQLAEWTVEGLPTN